MAHDSWDAVGYLTSVSGPANAGLGVACHSLDLLHPLVEGQSRNFSTFNQPAEKVKLRPGPGPESKRFERSVGVMDCPCVHHVKACKRFQTTL